MKSIFIQVFVLKDMHVTVESCYHLEGTKKNISQFSVFAAQDKICFHQHRNVIIGRLVIYRVVQKQKEERLGSYFQSVKWLEILCEL